MNWRGARPRARLRMASCRLLGVGSALLLIAAAVEAVSPAQPPPASPPRPDSPRLSTGIIVGGAFLSTAVLAMCSAVVCGAVRRGRREAAIRERVFRDVLGNGDSCRDDGTELAVGRTAPPELRAALDPHIEENNVR